AARPVQVAPAAARAAEDCGWSARLPVRRQAALLAEPLEALEAAVFLDRAVKVLRDADVADGQATCPERQLAHSRALAHSRVCVHRRLVQSRRRQLEHVQPETFDRFSIAFVV